MFDIHHNTGESGSPAVFGSNSESRTYSSYSERKSNRVQKSSPQALEANSKTLKCSDYSAKNQRKIRALAHTLYNRASAQECLPFIFTLTVPGSTIEAAYAIDQHAVMLIRALVAKIRAQWLNGEAFDWLCVFERAGQNPLHFPGLLALPKSAWKFATDENLQELGSVCLHELSSSIGVDLFESRDGIIWREARRCEIETVRNQNAWANYLAKSESKFPLLLPNGNTSVPARWYDANKALLSAREKATFECHFEVDSISAGLKIIDDLLLPTVEKITGPLDWREHFNREWKRRIGSYTAIPPEFIPKVTKALKKHQRLALQTQESFLHRPDLLMSLDAGGALMLRLRQKRIA